MKRALSSAESKRTVTRSKPPIQASPQKHTRIEAVGDIRAHLEQRTHEPLHLAAEQEVASHSAPVWHGETPLICDPLV